MLQGFITSCSSTASQLIFLSSRFEILQFTFDVQLRFMFCSFDTELFLMGSAQLLTLSERRAMKETMFIVHTVHGNLRKESFGTEAAFCWETTLMINGRSLHTSYSDLRSEHHGIVYCTEPLSQSSPSILK